MEMVPGRADEIFDPGTMSEVGQRSCNSEDLALANERYRWFAEYVKVFIEACVSPPPNMQRYLLYSLAHFLAKTCTGLQQPLLS